MPPIHMSTKILYNKYLLYTVFLLAIGHIYYLIYSNNTNALIVFVLFGFIVSFFSKNITVILLIAIVFSGILLYGFNIHKELFNGLEGLSTEDDSTNNLANNTDDPNNLANDTNNTDDTNDIPKIKAAKPVTKDTDTTDTTDTTELQTSSESFSSYNPANYDNNVHTNKNVHKTESFKPFGKKPVGKKPVGKKPVGKKPFGNTPNKDLYTISKV